MPFKWFLGGKRILVFFVVAFVSLACLASVLIYVYHRIETEKQTGEIHLREMGQIRIYESIIVQLLHELKSDLLSLSGHHLIVSYVTSKNEKLLNDLAKDFKSFSLAKQHYDQIRIICGKGNERLRVNNNGKQCWVVPFRQLQPKINRYYVKEAMNLKPGQVYLSKFDLNVELGKIEKPLKPILRLATPLLDGKGEKRGILVLNYLGKDLFARLTTAQDMAHGQLMILNQQGYWLKGPWPQAEWGFMFPGGKNHFFARRFPKAWTQIEKHGQGQIIPGSGLFTYVSIDPFKILHTETSHGPRRWIIVSWISQNHLATLLETKNREHLALWLSFVLLCVPVAWFLAYTLNRSLSADEQVHILSRFPSENPNPVLRVNQEGRLVYANPASKELLHWWDIEEGMNLPGEFMKVLARSLKGDETKETEVVIKNRTYLFLAAPLANTKEIYLYGRDVTDLKQAEEALKETEERYRLLSQEAPISIMTCDKHGIINFVNKWHLKNFGSDKYGTDFFLGKSLDQLPGLVSGGVVQSIKEVLKGKIADLPEIYVSRFSGGRSGYQTIRAVPLIKNGEIDGGIIIREDVTEIKKAYDQIELSRKVFDNSIEGISVTDEDGNIQYVNNAFTKITGYGWDEVVGKNPRLLKSDRHDPEFYKKMWRALTQEGHWEGEIWNRRKNGEAYPEWLAITAIEGDGQSSKRYVALFHDMSDLRRAEEEIEYKSNYDALTGLLSRDVFRDRLIVALSHVQAQKSKLAVFSVDLNDFKVINNSLGHTAGDELLQKVATRLEAGLGEKATVARLGGDEFLVMIEGLRSGEEARKTAQIIQREVTSLPYPLMGQELYLTLSIGIALAPDDGIDADSLIKNSDLAVIRAKQNGRNQWEFFSQVIGKAANKRLKLENALHRALDNNEFQIYYQPKVELVSRKISSMEALVRWQRPGEGLISPNDFIPLAESTGLIVPIGKWVLGESCRQTKVWRDSGFPDLRVAVNLSVRQLQEADLLKMVRGVLASTGLPAAGLVLEITESAVMSDVEVAEAALHELHAMGIKISLDDFGTGYSSLSYLRRLPIDSVKIDKSFVDDIPFDPEANAVVETIISMAHSLHLKVIAEGVETREQLDFLAEHHCDLIQGYYFSKPLPGKEFASFLRESH